MKHAFYVFVALFLLSIVLLGVVFSHHGFLDYLRLQKEIRATQDRITFVEKENQDLKRKVDLLEKPSPEFMENYLRGEVGFLKKNEILYFESSR